MNTRQDSTRWGHLLGAVLLVASLSLFAVGLPVRPAHAAPAVVTDIGWAVVNPNGSLVRASGVVSSATMGPALYRVDFGNSCVIRGSYLATLGLGKGPVTALTPGEIAVAPAGPTSVEVGTFNSAGAPTPLGFHLEVNC